MKENIHLIFIPFLVLSTLGLILFSCTKDELNTDSSFRLEFSSDTIVFDTVFTTIGSTVRQLLVHNTSHLPVVIESAKLARGNASPFRINIDGVAATQVDDLEIAANDSAYIFIKVTIDPNNHNGPLIETDSIVFLTNGIFQDIKLVAWGQDAYFYFNDTLSGDVHLRAEKPHVIYGNLTADSLCNLTIDKGTRLFFHLNSGLKVRNGGSVRVEGTLEEPVLFRGDRLEYLHIGVSGQWLGIHIQGGSKDNYFQYADIQDGRIGIELDSAEIGDTPRAVLYNCTIHNMVNYGILSTHSNIRVLNSRITNCGGYAVAIDGGGKCEFRHCTLSNYWSSSTKQFPTLYLSNSMYVNGSLKPVALDSAYFGNCIISGNSQNELILDKSDETTFNFLFDHCLVSTGLSSGYTDFFKECRINEDPKFFDPWNGYFELDTLSMAKDAGWLPVIDNAPMDLTYDLKGISRKLDSGPDLGCYERVEVK